MKAELKGKELATELFTHSEIEILSKRFPNLQVRGVVVDLEQIWTDGSRGKRRLMISRCLEKKERKSAERLVRYAAKVAERQAYWNRLRAPREAYRARQKARRSQDNEFSGVQTNKV